MARIWRHSHSLGLPGRALMPYNYFWFLLRRTGTMYSPRKQCYTHTLDEEHTRWWVVLPSSQLISVMVMVIKCGFWFWVAVVQCWEMPRWHWSWHVTWCVVGVWLLRYHHQGEGRQMAVTGGRRRKVGDQCLCDSSFLSLFPEFVLCDNEENIYVKFRIVYIWDYSLLRYDSV
jgi:hypothetical protein